MSTTNNKNKKNSKEYQQNNNINNNNNNNNNKTKKSSNNILKNTHGAISLSVIVPVYNESDRIEAPLREIYAFLSKEYFAGSFEVLIVDDGSTDDTIAKAQRLSFPAMKILKNKHFGKGWAVRTGFLHAKGERVLFTDCDLATPLISLNTMQKKMNEGYDVVIANRNNLASPRIVNQLPLRRHLGKVFLSLMNLLFGLNVSDTQCGFKLFTLSAAQQIAQKQTVKGWAFDVEQLVIAQQQGLQVSEVAVEWTNKGNSRVNILRDGFPLACDLTKIWLARMNGSYANVNDSNRDINKTYLRKKEIGFFFIVGGISTLVDWSVFALLTLTTISHIIALCISYISGAIVNYIGNRILTFKSATKFILQQIGVFSLVVGFNLLLSVVVFFLLQHTIVSNALIARIITTGVIFISNYFMHKNITFRS